MKFSDIDEYKLKQTLKAAKELAESQEGKELLKLLNPNDRERLVKELGKVNPQNPNADIDMKQIEQILKNNPALIKVLSQLKMN